MAETSRDLRPKSTEPYSKQGYLKKNNRRNHAEAAWKDITERLQRMERKEVQHATKVKVLQDMYQTERNSMNPRQAAATGHAAGNQALDRKELPVMKDQIAKMIDVINTPKQRTLLQMKIET